MHPDVRRMLLTIRAYTEAGRAFAVFAGLNLDRGKYAGRCGLPGVVGYADPRRQAFLSDRGFECAVIAQQVFGGHGFIQGMGVEQIVRDARIAQIYEGANGIQALDFVERKVCRDGGRTLYSLLDTMAATPVPDAYRALLRRALERLRSVTERVVAGSREDANLPGAVSTDYLDLAGHTIYAWLWRAMAGASCDDDFGRAKRRTADFFYGRLLPEPWRSMRARGRIRMR